MTKGGTRLLLLFTSSHRLGEELHSSQRLSHYTPVQRYDWKGGAIERPSLPPLQFSLFFILPIACDMYTLQEPPIIAHTPIDRSYYGRLPDH